MRYVKCDNIPKGTGYHTNGKVYAVKEVHDLLGWIMGDNGIESLIRFDRCAHLDGRPWIFCDAEGNPV